MTNSNRTRTKITIVLGVLLITVSSCFAQHKAYSFGYSYRSPGGHFAGNIVLYLLEDSTFQLHKLEQSTRGWVGLTTTVRDTAKGSYFIQKDTLFLCFETPDKKESDCVKWQLKRSKIWLLEPIRFSALVLTNRYTYKFLELNHFKKAKVRNLFFKIGRSPILIYELLLRKGVRKKRNWLNVDQGFIGY